MRGFRKSIKFLSFQVLQNSDGSEITYRLADTPFNNNDTAKKLSVTFHRNNNSTMAEPSKGGGVFGCTVRMRQQKIPPKIDDWENNVCKFLGMPSAG